MKKTGILFYPVRSLSFFFIQHGKLLCKMKLKSNFTFFASRELKQFYGVKKRRVLRMFQGEDFEHKLCC